MDRCQRTHDHGNSGVALMPKVMPPETEQQAETFRKVLVQARRFGFCIKCAAQLGWGHQNGFANVHPPCVACAPLVAELPKERLQGWRTVIGHADRWGPWDVARGSQPIHVPPEATATKDTQAVKCSGDFGVLREVT